jgi:hypothetical protein
MNTKKSEKSPDAELTPVAAKPLRKTAAVKVAANVKADKPVEEKVDEQIEVEAKRAKAKSPKKPKVVRDSFTMPEHEYQKIFAIKAQCLSAGIQIKKSEILRAGVIALCALNESQLIAALGGLDKIKTGRPNKN